VSSAFPGSSRVHGGPRHATRSEVRFGFVCRLRRENPMNTSKLAKAWVAALE